MDIRFIDMTNGQTPKFRIPKSVGDPRPEVQVGSVTVVESGKLQCSSALLPFGFPSDFGFRISDFFHCSPLLLLAGLLLGCHSHTETESASQARVAGDTVIMAANSPQLAAL